VQACRLTRRVIHNHCLVAVPNTPTRLQAKAIARGSAAEKLFPRQRQCLTRRRTFDRLAVVTRSGSTISDEAIGGNFYLTEGTIVARESGATMSKRARRNHSPAFKAKGGAGGNQG
jgi:hypothetical protein